MKTFALVTSIGSIFMGALCIGLYVGYGHWYSLVAGLFALPTGIICTCINFRR